MTNDINQKDKIILHLEIVTDRDFVTPNLADRPEIDNLILKVHLITMDCEVYHFRIAKHLNLRLNFMKSKRIDVF